MDPRWPILLIEFLLLAGGCLGLFGKGYATGLLLIAFSAALLLVLSAAMTLFGFFLPACTIPQALRLSLQMDCSPALVVAIYAICSAGLVAILWQALTPPEEDSERS